MTPDLAFVLVAAGRGARMGAPLPKQYLPLEGRPILARTLDRVAPLLREEDLLLLVIPPEDDDRVKRLLETCHPHLRVTTVHGGAARTESVRHALRLVPQGTRLVAIHDGVRPFLTRALWERLRRALEEDPTAGAAVPALLPTDSLRLLDDRRGSVPLDRSRVRLVQTPQLFVAREIIAAYARETETATDDASVYSAYRSDGLVLVEGDEYNIKITTPRDLAVAAWILRQDLGGLG